ncbi:hypothetical protein KAI68_04710 [bacterium]|nr:hypothetical protein [bacterium]
MPGGDGTGPFGQGPRRGGGRGQGGGFGGGRGGMGPGSFCLCPKCGNKVAHQAGVPCTTLSCPNCGTKMIRK